MSKQVLDVGNCAPDHAAVRDLIESNFDAQVVQAHSSQDALQALRGGAFDLVLINRKMDRDQSDGLEIIHQIKADADIADVPVMMITNYDDHQQLAIQAGAVAGFGKLQLHDAATRDSLLQFLA